MCGHRQFTFSPPSRPRTYSTRGEPFLKHYPRTLSTMNPPARIRSENNFKSLLVSLAQGAAANDEPTTQISLMSVQIYIHRFPFSESCHQDFAPTGFGAHADGGSSMLILVQTPAIPRPGSHPGPWSPSDIWVVLLLPVLIVAFWGLVFVRSRRGQINRMRK
jgi:hypothetical protein